jgi:DNA-binding transcriptional LysR family regulator
VHEVARAARAVLSPQTEALDIASLERTFTLRANGGFVERFAAPLVAAISEAAPRVRLRFAPKPEKDAGPLREGQIDLEIGVLGASAPEIRTQLLFRDDFIGFARTGHPLLAEAVTPERYAACKHVCGITQGKLRRARRRCVGADWFAAYGHCRRSGVFGRTARCRQFGLGCARATLVS